MPEKIQVKGGSDFQKNEMITVFREKEEPWWLWVLIAFGSGFAFAFVNFIIYFT